MDKKLYIIDNFYKNPDAVRKLALRAPYEDVTNLNYPGDQSKFAYTSNGVKEKFESIIRCSIETDESTMTFGKFRIMRDDERSWLKVHVDGISDWTAVIYLNPNESCQGGTAFYQHKETHLEGPPSFNELSRMGFNAYAEFEKKILTADTHNLAKWQETMFVGMKFNRLVLFRGNELFHAHTQAFGHSVTDGRLTQNFFFNEVKNDDES